MSSTTASGGMKNLYIIPKVANYQTDGTGRVSSKFLF